MEIKKEKYLESYMAKNLFYYNCADRFEYNTEKTDTAKYIQLAPLGYTPEKVRGSENIVINNPHLFWQAPQ